MRFIADKDIPFVKEAFSTIGDVTLLPAGKITCAEIKQADALLVRTTTKVTENLLQGSAVRFVGTATIGTDHVDRSFLSKAGIGFSSAPGCNANAVGEFVINTICRYADANAIDLKNATIGIIGAGNTGSAVQKKAEILGMSCLLNDPPLQAATTGKDCNRYHELADLIEQATILSFHVPFTRKGPHPTFHLLDEKLIRRLKPDTIVINTSRGGVIDEETLLKNRSRFRGLILDVWENEPSIDTRILDQTDIATPHVAGYSFDGKIQATWMIYRAACRFFNRDLIWSPESVLEGHIAEVTLPDRKPHFPALLGSVYDIFKDDRDMRQLPDQADPALYFAELRNNYQFRNEFKSVTLKSHPSLPRDFKRLLVEFGFRV